ncbi:hypothetical protein [Streptomyces bullii]|uniref:Uncharacterized protein n=1 Tax=Streptomyces bullii TaxID=349910 RepID=A0ABW0UR11_9ACTN
MKPTRADREAAGAAYDEFSTPGGPAHRRRRGRAAASAGARVLHRVDGPRPRGAETPAAYEFRDAPPSS